jgi:hypothetical protein
LGRLRMTRRMVPHAPRLTGFSRDPHPGLCHHVAAVQTASAGSGRYTVRRMFRSGVASVYRAVYRLLRWRIIGLGQPLHRYTETHAQVRMRACARVIVRARGVSVYPCSAFLYLLEDKEIKRVRAATPPATPAARRCSGLVNPLKSFEKGAKWPV